MDGNAPNFNQPNSLYSYPNQNPNYMPPQMNIESQNNEGYNSQGINIYSGYSPQMGDNIYSQASGNIYSQPQDNQVYGAQPSENIYTAPPQSNPPLYAPQTSGNINPEYAPPISGDINQAYIPNTSGEIALSPVNVPPVSYDTTNIPTSTEPLVPTSDVVVVKSSCCETDESIEELTGCHICGVIFSCVALAIIGFNDMVFTLRTKSINHALFLIPDLLYLFFAIFESITIMRVRWLRTCGGVLSIVFLVLSIVFGILQLIHLNNHKGEDVREGHDFVNDCIPFTYIRIVVFVIILNIIFYVYWRIKICCRCENTGSSSTYYEYDSGTTYITTTTTSPSYHHPHHHHIAPHHSAPHLRSAPHHSAPHHSAPHHSAPHHAPHHSAPHRSAPHHAPHHSAPHHSAHHSAHHGGHRRH